jgi:hypothetical protein
MRTRRYSWRLNHLPKTLRATVYADRSVELDIVHHDGNDKVTRRADFSQTRVEAAWMLRFARPRYTIEKEYL